MTRARRVRLRALCSISLALLPWALVAAGDVTPLSAPIDHDDRYLYRLPYGDGVDYPVIQSYGSRFSHTGAEFYTIDFAMPEGTVVHAAREGVVIGIDASNSRRCLATGCEAYANHVIVEHADGTTAEYAHLQKEGVLVVVGQYVARGHAIALSGNTGYTNAPHLHFGVYAADLTDRPRSIEVRFVTAGGAVKRLRVGRRYRNVAIDRFARR